MGINKTSSFIWGVGGKYVPENMYGVYRKSNPKEIMILI